MSHFPVPRNEFYFLGLIRSEYLRIRRSLARHRMLWHTPDRIPPHLAKQAERAYRRNASFVTVAAAFLQTMPDAALAAEARALSKRAPALLRALKPFIAMAHRRAGRRKRTEPLTFSPLRDAASVALTINETADTALFGNDRNSPHTPGWYTNEHLDRLEDWWQLDRQKLAHYRRQVSLWRKAPLNKTQRASVDAVERAIAKLDRTLARIKIDHITARTYVTAGRTRTEIGDYLWSMAGPDTWEQLV